MSGTVALAKNRKTPGIYITEFPAFPPSIVGVETAVPVFVGYTQYARDPSSGKQLYMQAIPVSSMADYYNYFGFGFDTKYVVTDMATAIAAAQKAAADADKAAQAKPDDKDLATAAALADAAALAAQQNYDFLAATTAADGTVTTDPYSVGTSSDKTVVPRFNLYMAMQLFYANGGGNCFVVSVANYWGTQSAPPAAGTDAVTVNQKDLSNGLDIAHDTRGATMLVVPDACLLLAQTGADYTDYDKIAQKMLVQASSLQDRVAILDLPGALDPAGWTQAGLAAQAAGLYTAIAPEQTSFSYGAAYAPAVESSVLTIDDVDYTNLQGAAASIDTMNMLLTTQANILYPTLDKTAKTNTNPKFADVSARIGAAFKASGTPALPQYSPYNDKTFAAPTDADGMNALEQYLRNAVPLLGQIQQILVGKLNVAPPSGVMAGVWTKNDATRGFWNAPANISLASVIGPKVVLTDAQQGDYNVPLNGNAIDILRAMVNRGTVVWGARTLDGNSEDYKYIQVRRTLIYIEQSIKLALQPFVFAANDGNTWVTVTGMISNFLTNLWQSGGLMGDKASDAFSVKCGLGSTMTGQDILDGYMIVNVTVQMVHPAEFIELTFTQSMQGV
jgi:phage tail sheath protein FI